MELKLILEVLVFEERGKPEYPEKKPPSHIRRRVRPTNPGQSHWWEGSALTTAPSATPEGKGKRDIRHCTPTIYYRAVRLLVH